MPKMLFLSRQVDAITFTSFFFNNMVRIRRIILNDHIIFEILEMDLVMCAENQST